MRKLRWTFECHVCGAQEVSPCGTNLPHGWSGSDTWRGMCFCPECSRKLELVDRWGFRKSPRAKP